MAKPSGQTLFLAASLLLGGVALGYVALFYGNQGLAGSPEPIQTKLTLREIPFRGEQAYEYLKRLCAIGPRPSGSTGMKKQQELLADHFRKLGGGVQFQNFRARHPLTGAAVPMSNLIVQWHPDRRERILLAAHYDTRPFPDRDRINPRGTFVGANDGASGVAILMELARKMRALDGRLGIDFVLFDGEELVFNEQGDYFLGSEVFARDYAANPPEYRYRWAVVLDMVGDADLQVYQEGESVGWRDSRPLVNEIWETAQRLGVKEFVPRKKHDLRDDHLPLHNTAKIPACDIIDFDYPYWHTTGDTPERCSALSLAKVGWVMQEWLTAAIK